LHPIDRIGRHTARLAVLLKGIDEPSLGRKEQLEQLASLPNRGSALIGFLDCHAMFLSLIAQYQGCWQAGDNAGGRAGGHTKGPLGSSPCPPPNWALARVATIKAANSRVRQTLMALPRCP